MADNAALRSAHRAAALHGRRAAEAVGARPTTVTLRVEVYSAAIGTSGASITTTTDTVLDPRPKVVPAGAEDSAFGGGPVATSAGRLRGRHYRIGPITLDHPGGGYSIATLAPAGSTTTRVRYLLAGDDFDAGGELFELVLADASRPHQVTLEVRRVEQP